jgi:hypothetical protein
MGEQMTDTPQTDSVVSGLRSMMERRKDFPEMFSQVQATLIQHARKLEAENAALRKDAERYQWFRSKRLWDADQFPWPKDFEYPDPCLWDAGEMLDAAIDAARKL